MRTIALTSVVLVVALCVATRADACGDKFLTATCGTGANQTEATGGSATIVLYQPDEATEKGGVRDPELEKHLRDAGWHVEITEGIDSLRAALAQGAEAVLVDLSHIEQIRSNVASLEADTVLVPVMSNPSRAAYREAAKDYTYLMRTPSGRGHVQSVLTKVLQRGA